MKSRGRHERVLGFQHRLCEVIAIRSFCSISAGLSARDFACTARASLRCVVHFCFCDIAHFSFDPPVECRCTPQMVKLFFRLANLVVYEYMSTGLNHENTFFGFPLGVLVW